MSSSCNSTYRLRYWNLQILFSFWIPFLVATAPTVYGIETRQCKSQSHRLFIECCNSTYRLRYWNFQNEERTYRSFHQLQQHLPFTVLKPFKLSRFTINELFASCNSTYRLRYWNSFGLIYPGTALNPCCNSTYRLRYWNAFSFFSFSCASVDSCNSTYRLWYATMRSAHLLPEQSEGKTKVIWQ